MWMYRDERDGLRDALNLSKAMTYKCAMAGVKFGGGKGVILGNPETEKTPELLKAYARLVKDYFGESFRTATDVGLTDADVKVMSTQNPFMVGVMNNGDKLSISNMATLGVFYSIQGCFEEVLMKSDLRGKKFAIKGLGKTGMELARLLHDEGAEIVAAEIDKKKVALAKSKFPNINIVSPSRIHKQEVDVYVPCALGGDLTRQVVGELRCQFVIGSANNQLASPEVGEALYARGIVYAPDYVVNAGGLINVVDELEPDGYKKTRVLQRVKDIKKTIRRVIARSQKERQSTNLIADQMAEEILNKKKR
jgi:glutamate dehydrogenase/leucine dehydrogenase